MSLANQLLKQISDSLLGKDEQVMLRCQHAKELENIGNYEAARGAMGDLWQRVGVRPMVDGLEVHTAAEVLLRAGVLSGWIGRSRQIEGAQESAKDLISESMAIFEKLNNPKKVAEALTELGYCYWREGAHDEARVTLADALSRLEDTDVDLKAVALVRCAIVEASATRFHDTFRILTEAAPFAEASTNHSVKGRFHVEMATVLKHLGAAERREDHIDRALIEYAAASYHFERAGHTRYYALVENNLGYLFSSIGKFNEAHEHLDCARRIFTTLKDTGSVAQVDDTRARVLLGQGRNPEAEKVIRGAVRALEKGGENALLAEALTTHGSALARMGRRAEAKLTLERAMEVAEPAGDAEGAGIAALTIIEELGDSLSTSKLSRLYKRADHLLSRSQNAGTVDRLFRAARRIVLAQHERTQEFSTRSFIHADEQTAQLLHETYRVAGADGTVLITGETGTGKEILARLIHDWSGRAGALVAINCATLTDTLIESQLFGHKKGSFTGAIEDYSGVARKAAGGTLFLDEVTELSPANQSKLLRLIEQGEIHSIGSAMPEQIDIRIIAATNRDLKAEVAGRRFRNDLFYRLQTFHLEIPPLRARPEDIPVIAEHFIEEATERLGKRINFTPEAVAAMKSLPLKGNARELRSLIERTILTAADDTIITPETITTVALRQTQKASFANPWTDFSLKEEVRLFEERFIEIALRDAKGMVSVAARLLGFKHHESLNYRLTHRNKTLQSARKPAEPRKRSIIREMKK